jgi:integrase
MAAHRTSSLPLTVTQTADRGRIQMTVRDRRRPRLLTDDFFNEWWEIYAVRHLRPSTLDSYRRLWWGHVSPHLGAMPLDELMPLDVWRMRNALHDAGVGGPTIWKAMALLQGVLARAVEWGRIWHNPATVVRKPHKQAVRAVRPLSPLVIETMRHDLLLRGRLRCATLVSLLAYGGLRPGEAMGLKWKDVQAHSLIVERRTADGRSHQAPKCRLPRAVLLCSALRQDLDDWFEQCPDTSPDSPVIPAQDGSHWNRTRWHNWRCKQFARAARAAAIDGARPYDLRHSFVSLMYQQGATLAEIAEQAGHSKRTALETYGHVMLEHGPGDRMSPDEQIARARRDALTGHER